MNDTALIRDDKGRWARGNPGGPGRPARTVEDGFLDFLRECLENPEVREKAMPAIVERLKVADLKTWQFVASYLVGLPIQRVKVEAQQSILAGILGDLRNDEAANPETLANSRRESEDPAPA